MIPERIVIIGAGPTGLGAAHRLRELGHENFVVLEANDLLDRPENHLDPTRRGERGGRHPVSRVEVTTGLESTDEPSGDRDVVATTAHDQRWVRSRARHVA